MLKTALKEWKEIGKKLEKSKKVAVKAGTKAGTAAKMAQGAIGPVGWALAVADLVSLALDVFNVGGYDNVDSIQQFLIERETAKKNHNDYLKSQLKEMKKQGIKA